MRKDYYQIPYDPFPMTLRTDRSLVMTSRRSTLPSVSATATTNPTRSAEFLGKSDEKPFRPADVAEPIRVLILNYFAYELRTQIAEPFKCLVDVVHREHDAQVAQGVHRGIAVIRDGGGREEAGELEPAVAVRRAHHGNLNALIAQSSDASGPFSFDRCPPFELEAEFPKKSNRLSEVIDDNSYVVHPFERHLSNL